MRVAHVELLVCPECQGALSLTAGGGGERVEQGTLTCEVCRRAYPILRSIPRFVPQDNYASSFGFEWLKHARSQYDSHTGTTISEDRFFGETRWPRELPGERILEVGGGSGRFTEQAVKTGATVVSLDYSAAVEANYASNGQRENLLIVQADMLRPPLRPASFERVYCFGVLQHTPDPERSFRALPRFLAPGGHLAVDVYLAPENLRNKLFATKYWARHLTKRVPPHLLYPVVERYVKLMWPASGVINRLAGNWVNWLLLVSDYRGMYDLPDPLLREWAILDTFDALSPRYDSPQTVETVQRWFRDAGLVEVDVHKGYNGIEGRGRAPAA